MKIPFSFTVPNGGEWLSFHGVPVELILNLAGFGLSRGFVGPGEGALPHRHSFGEGFYLLRGSLTVTVEDEVCQMQPGDFVHLPANVTHFIKNTGSQGAEVLVFSVPGQFNDFQREVSIAAGGPDGPFAPAPSDIRARMQEAGKKYGIEFVPNFVSKQQVVSQSERFHFSSIRTANPLATVGDLYRFLCTTHETAGAYSLWHAEVQPGAGPPPHRHGREEEMFHVLSGEMTFHCDGQSLTAGAGTTLLLPRDSAHFFHNDSNSMAEMLIAVTPAGLEQFFIGNSKPWDVSLGNPPLPTPELLGPLKQGILEYGVEILVG
jgi:quercetin dioxygenase-like cupin family protein